jgi:uncharacterized repeat protein (TIGR03803 family)
MENSRLGTILAVTTVAKELLNFSLGRGRKAGHGKKLSITKTAFIVSLFCASAAIISPAQTNSPSQIKFTSLLSFQGSNGANPGYVKLVQGKDGNLYGTTEVSTGDAGTVFKITTAGKLITLHIFCVLGYPCVDGANPYAGLMLSSNGKFYGTTFYGGTSNDGTVFQITSAGKLTTLHNFAGATDGSQPEAAPIQAANGLLYGPTSEGGSKNDGTLYEMTTAGKVNVSLSFTGANGIYPYAKLLQGTDGNYYGTTGQVTSGNGTIFAIKEAGLTTLHTFHGAPGGGFPVGGLVQATNGNFYGTTTTGGGNLSGGTVFQITAAGKLTTIYSFCAKPDCTDGSAPLATLIQATDGNLYGTTYHGGTNNTSCNSGCGTIFRITTAGKLTTLYNFCSQSLCADGSQPEGGLVQDTNGSFYGTTFYGGTVDVGTVYSLSVGLAPFVRTLPASGTAGASVIILGTNLTGATKVSFSGTAAKAFTIVSDTEITATVPTGAPTGMIEVTTPGGTLSSNQAFVIVP